MTLTSISSLKSPLNTRGIKLQTKIISSTRGEKVKRERKKHKLLLQIIAIVLPLFALMTAAVIWAVYSSTLKGYLEAQNDHIEDSMTNTLSYIPFVSGEVLDQESKDWMFQHMEEYRIDLKSDETDELSEKQKEYLNADNKYEYSWFKNMPEDLRYIYIKQYLSGTKNILYNNISNSSFDSMFIMDMLPQYRGLILIDFNKNEQDDKMGSYLEFDLSDHPALKKALDQGSDKIVFERATDFPNKGNYYIGYKPVIIGGETRAVVGITYKWDDFKDSIDSSVKKAIIILISGIAVVLLVLLFFLNRKAIRPTAKIQEALIDYTGDKDANQIVKKMYEIKAKNEIGYLADVISDLALEIDRYTKETARIAAEKERAQKELYEAELQIMVSQIRPHFLYNALTSIAMMCELDPKTAKEATIAFSKYLRGNMDSLKQTKAVPFEQELSHLKNYLYIEKLRFDDLLNIVYDIQATDFEVPQLSIQPIVENAVKHGVGMAEDGGTVTISTRETDDAYEVIVSDDGVGFDVNAPKKDDGRSHVGMENTKRRLKEMCKADIVITSEVGKGTTARVIIPKKEGKANEDTVS